MSLISVQQTITYTNLACTVTVCLDCRVHYDSGAAELHIRKMLTFTLSVYFHPIIDKTQSHSIIL